MARIKSSPRQSPQHSGELYESGYQYQHPERDILWLGPWQGMQLDGVLNPQTHMRLLHAARVENGMIRGGWNASTTVNATLGSYGAFSFGVNTLTHVWFYFSTATNTMWLRVSSFGTVTDVDTGLVIQTRVNSAVLWGSDTIYFTLSGLRKYVISTATFSTPVLSGVTGTPINVMELNNNLILATTSRDIYWSVDGSPEDFVGAGSGIHRFTGGQLSAHAKLGNTQYLIGYNATESMRATGVADPAFAFEQINHLPTNGLITSVVAATHNRLYYVDPLGTVQMFNGVQTQPVPGLIRTGVTSLFYSSTFDRLVLTRYIASTAVYEVYFINPHDHSIESRIISSTGAVQEAADNITTNGRELRLYERNGLTSSTMYTIAGGAYYTTTYGPPDLATGEIHFHRTVNIEQIVFIRPGRSGTVTGPDLNLLVSLRNRAGQVHTVIPTAVEDGEAIRFFVNGVCDSLMLSTVNEASWAADDRISRIGIFYSLQERQSAGAI